MAKRAHWTQTPEGKIKMSEIQKLAHKAKRGKYRAKKQPKEFKLVINGWRVTLGKNEVKLEND